MAFPTLMLAGCISPSFDPAFNSAAAAPLDSAQPILGAWQGEWTSNDGSAAGPARLVVAAKRSGTDTMQLELIGFPTAGVGQLYTADAAIDPRAGTVHDFTAKVPAIVVNGDLCAAALGLQAHADGDAMRIDYWLNDAMQQVDAGHMGLHRAGHATTRP